MIRLNPIPNARIHASALSALAAAVGLMLISAAPARADHVEQRLRAPPRTGRGLALPARG